MRLSPDTGLETAASGEALSARLKHAGGAADHRSEGWAPDRKAGRRGPRARTQTHAIDVTGPGPIVARRHSAGAQQGKRNAPGEHHPRPARDTRCTGLRHRRPSSCGTVPDRSTRRRARRRPRRSPRTEGEARTGVQGEFPDGGPRVGTAGDPGSRHSFHVGPHASAGFSTSASPGSGATRYRLSSGSKCCSCPTTPRNLHRLVPGEPPGPVRDSTAPPVRTDGRRTTGAERR